MRIKLTGKGFNLKFTDFASFSRVLKQLYPDYYFGDWN